jgi:hypothetical protein
MATNALSSSEVSDFRIAEEDQGLRERGTVLLDTLKLVFIDSFSGRGFFLLILMLLVRGSLSADYLVLWTSLKCIFFIISSRRYEAKL